MAKLRFAVWVPTYAWADSGPEHVRRLTESIRKCEQHDLDIWVIDHLLAAPGLYGVAWLEPLSVLAYAAALTQKVASVIARELLALGFNADYAPLADVNTNPKNPVIGIRSFGDTPFG